RPTCDRPNCSAKRAFLKFPLYGTCFAIVHTLSSAQKSRSYWTVGVLLRRDSPRAQKREPRTLEIGGVRHGRTQERTSEPVIHLVGSFHSPCDRGAAGQGPRKSTAQGATGSAG